MDMDTVTEATDLLELEIQHLKTVVKKWVEPRKQKVKGQLLLRTRCLGKTKKSREFKKNSFRQLKIENFLQKPKTRKLCISSDSEDLMDKVQALGDSESALPEPRADVGGIDGVEPISDSPLTSDTEVTNEEAKVT